MTISDLFFRSSHLASSSRPTSSAGNVKLTLRWLGVPFGIPQPPSRGTLVARNIGFLIQPVKLSFSIFLRFFLQPENLDFLAWRGWSVIGHSHAEWPGLRPGQVHDMPGIALSSVPAGPGPRFYTALILVMDDPRGCGRIGHRTNRGTRLKLTPCTSSCSIARDVSNTCHGR